MAARASLTAAWLWTAVAVALYVGMFGIRGEVLEFIIIIYAVILFVFNLLFLLTVGSASFKLLSLVAPSSWGLILGCMTVFALIFFAIAAAIGDVPGEFIGIISLYGAAGGGIWSIANLRRSNPTPAAAEKMPHGF